MRGRTTAFGHIYITGEIFTQYIHTLHVYCTQNMYLHMYSRNSKFKNIVHEQKLNIFWIKSLQKFTAAEFHGEKN